MKPINQAPKSDLFKRAREYTAAYKAPKQMSESKFTPVLYRIYGKATLDGIGLLAELMRELKTETVGCYPQIVIGVDTTQNTAELWTGVALLPNSALNPNNKIVITDIPFEFVLEKGGAQ